ncbi:MAG: hypothetical protein U5R46_12245 [Gammaproteobacteria bacterium]|nr:hypothetical protein [Gammaproteobacteria bacterium]
MALPLYLVAASAQAQWQPTLAEVGEEVRQPTSDIRIQLPSEVTVETLQWLALEINDIEVSEVVRLEESPGGFVIVVTPPQPLEPGSHRVRLVEYTPDGQILERGLWTLQTGSPTGFAEKSLDARTTVELGYRVEHDEAVRSSGQSVGATAGGTAGQAVADDDDFQGDGSARIQGRLAKDDWEVEADASLLYSSLGVDLRNTLDDPRDGDEVDIGEYLFTRSDQVSEINLGHHAVESDSLIIDDFYRRGVSATRSMVDGRATGTAFAMRAEPTIGRRDILGVEEVRSRVMGGVASVRPFDNSRVLTLSAAALSGKGNDDFGTSLAGRDVLAEGDAASISAESRLLDDKLRLRGEYARTDYDFDGINGDLDKIDDDARMLLAEVVPMQGTMLGDSPADLTIGAEYRQTGLFFRSIANGFLPSDKELRRVYSDFRWGGLNLSLSAGKEHDNVDEAPDLPRLDTDLVQFYASWSPRPEYDDEGNLLTPWYGRPSLSTGLQYGRQEQTRLPPDFSGSPLDRRTRSARVSASFNYPEWNWYVGHTLGFEDDLTRRTPDLRNEISDVGVNLSIARRLYAGLQYQYNRIFESDGTITRTSLWGVSLDAVLVPEKLTGRLNYSMNLDRTTDDSFSSDNAFLSFEIDWQVVQPRENRPGMSLWLRGDFQNFNDRLDSGNDSTPSQVFVGVTVDWPVSTGRNY